MTIYRIEEDIYKYTNCEAGVSGVYSSLENAINAIYDHLGADEDELTLDDREADIGRYTIHVPESEYRFESEFIIDVYELDAPLSE